MTRRNWFRSAAALATTALSGCGLRRGATATAARRPSAVAIVKANDYSVDLVATLRQAAKLCGLDLRGKRVLLKPNLVEFDSTRPINTSALTVAAAVEFAKSMGAADVRIGEGPGHRRDTLGIAEQAGYFKHIPHFEDLFTDLNRDEVVALRSRFPAGKIYLPQTVLAADIVISLPRMKTHHWAGVTLSMKNLFGLIPGSVYGWPKNPLHYEGISRSILEINRLVPNTVAIVDGIVAMEGNGPIQGSAKPAGLIVMSRDVVAADATCSRLMHIAPDRIDYLSAGELPGAWREQDIEQRGESIRHLAQPFDLPPGQELLRTEGTTHS
ncbi:MAG: DUF362 domain-containing protein [Bryobacterales bacterium]|nr:DUF362 domain-containing protein [Bryobacterales bacterium]